jgi:thioredoxin 1
MSEKNPSAIENDKETHASACGCGCGSCGRGQGKWAWIILVLAIVGVLIAKNAGKKQVAESTPMASAPPAAVAATGGAAAPETATPGKTLPRLVDLGGASCTMCKMMSPILEDLKTTYPGKLNVQFIDVWENPDEGKKYGVNVIPTQIFFDGDGKERFRHEGFFGKEDILAKWKEFGVDLGR